MKLATPFLSACLTLMLSTFAIAAVPEVLTMNDLVNRPDLWPPVVTITREAEIIGGVLKPGQTGRVIQWNGEDIGIDMGPRDGLNAIGPENCDLLDAANRMWSRLSAEQRELTMETVVNDSSLWPPKVMVTDGFDLTNGKSINPGQEYDLITIKHNWATLWSSEHKVRLQANIEHTNVVQGARNMMLLDAAQRPSRVIETLRNSMVDSAGKPMKVDSLDDKKLFVFFYDIGAADPSGKVASQVARTVDRLKTENPNILVVLVSLDEQEADQLKAMQSRKINWPGITYATFKESGLLNGYADIPTMPIPQLTVVDRGGKIIATGAEMPTEKVLANLEAAVKSTAE